MIPAHVSNGNTNNEIRIQKTDDIFSKSFIKYCFNQFDILLDVPHCIVLI